MESSEHEPQSEFEQRLNTGLLRARRLDGQFRVDIGGSGFYSRVSYTAPRRLHDEEVPPELSGLNEEMHISTRRLTGDQRVPQAIDAAREREAELIDEARKYFAAVRQMDVILFSLKDYETPHSGLLPLVRHALPLLPEIMRSPESGSTPDAWFAQSVLWRALDSDAEEAARMVESIAAYCRSVVDDEASPDRNVTQKLMRDIAVQLERCMADAWTGPRNPSERWTYHHLTFDLKAKAIAAIPILDSFDFMPDKFWQRFMESPLAAQSLIMIDALSDKLSSHDSDRLFGKANLARRTRLIENAARGAFENAKTHPARDTRKIETILRGITKNQQLSLDSLVKLANVIIESQYPGHFTRLRVDNSFADSGQALAVLLYFTLRDDASETELEQAKKETATFIRLMNTIIERAPMPISPVIQTIGDVAVRYADATPQELKALSKLLDTADDVGPMDALRRQQRWRRKQITGPGYGWIS